MYIRFQTSETEHEGSTKPLGIFQKAYKLRDSDILDYQKQYLKDLLERFDENLEVPTAFSRKSTSTWATKGISRYKETAKVHIQKSYELKRIFEEHDIYVEVRMTDTPGYIVYEDDIQIVAEPFKETL